ncbi:MAG: hypothetical protein JWP52_3273 [Rhizobacter sp.]|nr:hypothetical protein [Rhizobacter sp.]
MIDDSFLASVRRRSFRAVVAGLGAFLSACLVVAAPASTLAATSGEAPPKAWTAAPRDLGRLTNHDIGLVINTLDPYSVAVGDYYIQARKLEPDQVLRVELPVRAKLTPEEFQPLADSIQQYFGPQIQALALAWALPYGVGCNSLNGALALGYDPGLCANTCGRSRTSQYFNSSTARPFTNLQMRPSMLIAAVNVDSAKKLIDRGVASDDRLGYPGAPTAQAYYLSTNDAPRNVRARLFPPAGRVPSIGVDVHVEKTNFIQHVDDVLLYMTGRVSVEKLDTIGWLPGALADHLTSTGGQLDGSSGQMVATAWIESGATASYGTVTEPCNHVQKFPHPQLLLLHYAQGVTALEAYWKSVAWPQQGVFVGEPLAAPFRRPTQ